MRTRQQHVQAATTANKQSKDIAGGNEESGHKNEKEQEKIDREIVKESKDAKEKTNEGSEEMIDTISELNDLGTYLRALEGITPFCCRTNTRIQCRLKISSLLSFRRT